MGKRYLCPICEHELTGRLYCPECRRFRKNPLVYTGGLLPNESSSSFRLNEEIKKDIRPNSRVSVNTEPAYRTAGRVQTGRNAQRKTETQGFDTRYRDTCGSNHAHTYGVPNQDPHKKKKKSGVGKIVAVIWALIAVLSFGMELVTDYFESAGRANEVREESAPAVSEFEVPDVVLPDYALEDMDWTYQEFTEEEVAALGEPCSGYAHYEVYGEDYQAILQEYLHELWPDLVITSYDSGSYNTASVVGEEIYTYYQKNVTMDLEFADGAWGYVILISDTVTGELMEIDIYVDQNEDSFRKLMLLSACALEEERDRNEVWAEVQKCAGELTEGGYVFSELGISDLYMNSDEEGAYHASFSCMYEYDKYQ